MMGFTKKLQSVALRLPQLIASAPIFIKIVGIELIIGLLFGVVTYHLISDVVIDTHQNLGIHQDVARKQLLSLTESYLWTIAFCSVSGMGLALILTHLLLRPIRHMVRATKKISQGEFKTRVKVYNLDEVGELAASFNQMAAALERYRRKIREKESARVALIDQIVSTQEDERKKIARELHDQLGQCLSAVIVNIRSLSTEYNFSEDLSHKIESQVGEVVDEVHRLAWDLRPSILDDYGLDPSLARYTQETAMRYNVPIDYQSTFPKSVRLPDRIEANIYRLAQEAIINAVRHSRAERISVVLLKQNDEVTLVVEDNGMGFNVKSVLQEGHKTPLGLIGMRERATLLSGQFMIESTPGEGTMIQARIPIHEEH